MANYFKETYLLRLQKMKDEIEYVKAMGADSICRNSAPHKPLFSKIDALLVDILKEVKNSNSGYSPWLDAYEGMRLIDCELEGKNESGEKVGEGSDKILTARGLCIDMHKVFKYRFMDSYAIVQAVKDENVPKEKKKDCYAVLVARGLATPNK